ncbi:hypothetical protein QT971_03150 [Microcoleus sp. herbarium19]
MIGILAVARSPASTSGDAESSIEIPHHRLARHQLSAFVRDFELGRSPAL